MQPRRCHPGRNPAPEARGLRRGGREPRQLNPWRTDAACASFAHRRFTLAALVTAASGFGQQAPNQPAPAVVVTPAHVENVAPVSSFIGHVQAIQSVQIVPRVTAFIEDEPTPQGSDVKAGQVLFVLQKAQYEAAVQSAQAKLASQTPRWPMRSGNMSVPPSSRRAATRRPPIWTSRAPTATRPRPTFSPPRRR